MAGQVPPHPSPTPHLSVQFGVQHVPLTQVLPAPQVPQLTCFPQLSFSVPQLEVPQV